MKKTDTKTERPKNRKTDDPKSHVQDLSSVELHDLALAADCTVSYVSRVFSHDPKQSRGLTLVRARLFADYLGMTLDDLWKILHGTATADIRGGKRAAKPVEKARVRKDH